MLSSGVMSVGGHTVRVVLGRLSSPATGAERALKPVVHVGDGRVLLRLTVEAQVQVAASLSVERAPTPA